MCKEDIGALYDSLLLVKPNVFCFNLGFITCPSGITAIITWAVNLKKFENSGGAYVYTFKNVGVKIQKILIFRTILLTFPKNLGRRYPVVNPAPFKFFTFFGKQSPPANPCTP